MLTIEDWSNLTKIKQQREAQELKENRIKAIAGTTVSTMLVCFSLWQQLWSEMMLFASILAGNFVLLTACYRANSLAVQRNWIYAFFYVFLFQVFILGKYLMSGSTFSVVAFGFLSAFYFRELESSTPRRFIMFVIYCLGLFLILPVEMIVKVMSAIVMLFVAAGSFRNIGLNRDLTLLKQREASFKLFQKHRLYIEHHTINAITRMKYHVLMIRDSEEAERIRHLDSLNGELDGIATQIKNPSLENLRDFSV